MEKDGRPPTRATVLRRVGAALVAGGLVATGLADSTEAFSSCSDVTLEPLTGPPPTTPPPTTPSTTTPPPITPSTPTPSTTTPSTAPSPGNGTWRNDVAYLAGDRVTLDGIDYVAKWWTRGFSPDTAVTNEWETPWRKL